MALKIVKSESHYTEAALDEIELLDCVSNFSTEVISYVSVNSYMS